MRYDGDVTNIHEIQSFVKDVAESILQQVSSQRNNNQNHGDSNDYHVSIPEYCIARPTKGGVQESICYVNFSDAYYQ
tara:strand:+ start:47 stop:277 length:231 start_codon:yes stop_codon:yes gene_type:complete